MAEGDLFDRLHAGREAWRKVQQSLARYAFTPEQRQAVLDGMSRMAAPGDQLQSMVDMVDAFGPPLAQIEALRDELATQRAQVKEVEERLGHMEEAVERMALAGEQLVAFQKPFVQMAAIFAGHDIERPARRPDGSAEDEPE